MSTSYRESFREEAYELLAELETSLLDLEELPDDADAIGRVFRAMHTIKGSGAMFGFDEMAAFTHEVETVFDLVRSGTVAVTKSLVDLTLAARDEIKGMLDLPDGAEVVRSERAQEITAALRKFIPAPCESVATPVKKGGTPPKAPDNPLDPTDITYRIRFRPTENIFMSGTNPLNLLNELRQLGACRVVALLNRVPVLDALNPESCYLYWDIVLTTRETVNAILDIFIFIEDECELKVDVIDDGGQLDTEGDYKKLGEILVERGDLAPESLEQILSGQKRIGELLVEAGLVEPDKIEAALVEQKHVKEIRQERQSQDSGSSIRVPAERLDLLVNLVGELVTVQARLSQMAAQRKDVELVAIAEEVERLTAELRDNALNIRMLPIGTTFSKFKRLVRDLSSELGKEMELTTAGEETELDKTVIEKLGDPLIHLIRNSIDHGIELPEVRAAAGKPRKGTVHLAAVHSGDSVVLTIYDDGAGLDKGAIRAKAVEKGLITANAELSERETFALIFAPGFSTATKVTGVSGRGVGMDVVKRAIDALRGSIEIASRKDEGTTITVRIPLTLAIIESLLVRIGSDCFVLPLSLVEECVELTRADVANAHGRHLANVRGQIVPYIPLREQFRIAGEAPAIEQIVIAEVNGMRAGFAVDHVVGEHQTVIKSLGQIYKTVKGVSGATILGDGTVALILDLPHLMQGAEVAERAG